jgi:hypothetical protein
VALDRIAQRKAIEAYAKRAGFEIPSSVNTLQNGGDPYVFGSLPGPLMPGELLY